MTYKDEIEKAEQLLEDFRRYRPECVEKQEYLIKYIEFLKKKLEQIYSN